MLLGVYKPLGEPEKNHGYLLINNNSSMVFNKTINDSTYLKI